MTSQRDALEGLLEICDQIRTLQDRIQRRPGDSSERTLLRMRARVRTLRHEVFALLPAVQQKREAAELSDPELLALALLFHGRVTGREPALEGGQLVALLARAGYPRTAALEALAPEAPLVARGWVRARRAPGDAHYPLDARFAPSSAALEVFWPSLADEAVETPEPEEPALAYRSEEECLWDYFHWRNLCIQRAGSLFDNERPEGLPTGRYRTLRREARATLVRIRARLAVTTGSQEYRVERFRRDHGLGSDDLLVVLHLLFGELVEGEPYLSALECLRMVAETRNDILRKRRVVSPHGRLRREGIVAAAHEEYGKALATELSLADWAADELLSGLGKAPRLGDDELDELLRGDDS